MPRTLLEEKTSETPEVSLKKEFLDTDMVTVLHGWGRVRPGEQHFIDKVLFVDGVARNVLYSIAKHWGTGLRPDGKEAHGKVHVHILPNDAGSAEFMQATGIQPMPQTELAALIAGCDINAVFDALGAEKAMAIANALKARAGK